MKDEINGHVTHTGWKEKYGENEGHPSDYIPWFEWNGYEIESRDNKWEIYHADKCLDEITFYLVEEAKEYCEKLGQAKESPEAEELEEGGIMKTMKHSLPESKYDVLVNFILNQREDAKKDAISDAINKLEA